MSFRNEHEASPCPKARSSWSTHAFDGGRTIHIRYGYSVGFRAVSASAVHSSHDDDTVEKSRSSAAAWRFMASYPPYLRTGSGRSHRAVRRVLLVVDPDPSAATPISAALGWSFPPAIASIVALLPAPVVRVHPEAKLGPVFVALPNAPTIALFIADYFRRSKRGAENKCATCG